MILLILCHGHRKLMISSRFYFADIHSPCFLKSGDWPPSLSSNCLTDSVLVSALQINRGCQVQAIDIGRIFVMNTFRIATTLPKLFLLGVGLRATSFIVLNDTSVLLHQFFSQSVLSAKMAETAHILLASPNDWSRSNAFFNGPCCLS